MSKEPSIKEPKPRKPPTHGMKWVKLGQGKDPEFNKWYFLFDPTLSDKFYIGMLIGKNVTGTGIVYTWELLGRDESGVEIETKTITHYCEPKPPVD